MTALPVLPLAAMAGGASASAATDSAVKAPVHCTQLSGNPIKDKGLLGGCGKVATRGKGKLSSFLPTGATISWANGSTTTYTSTYTKSGSLCPVGSLEYNITGSVTSSTNRYIPVGAPVKMTACAASKLITNAPGTRIAI
jgi:hypothetical protein